MDKEIWVYAELADGKPAPVFYELIAKADEIASTKGWNTAAVILGSNLDHVVETLQDVVDKIYVAPTSCGIYAGSVCRGIRGAGKGTPS